MYAYTQNGKVLAKSKVIFYNDLAGFFRGLLDKNCIDQSIYNKSEREILKFKTATKSV